MPNFKTEFLFNEKYSYLDCVKFYALSKSMGNDVADWGRVIWNIVESVEIDHASSMLGAIRLIDELSEHCQDGILQFLHDVCLGKKSITSGFARDQVREECLKAWLIETAPNNDAARELICNIEKDDLFNGRIISLMLKWQDESSNQIAWDKYYHENEEPEIRISTSDLVNLETLQCRYERLKRFLRQRTDKDIGKTLLKYTTDNHDYCIWLEGDQWQFVSSRTTLLAFLHKRSNNFYKEPIIIFSMFLDGSENNEFERKGFAFSEDRCWRYYFYNYFLSNSKDYRYSGLSGNPFKIEALHGDSGRSTHYSPFLDEIAEGNNATYQYQQGRGNRTHSDGHIHINDGCEMWIECPDDDNTRFKIRSKQELAIPSGKFLGQNDGYYIYTVDFNGDVIVQGRQLLVDIEVLLSRN